MTPDKYLKHAKTKRRIIRFIKDIEWLFCVNGFDRAVKFKECDENNMAAEIRYDEPYQMVTVSIYPCFFGHNPKEQRKMLLHEFCHTITIPSKVAMRALLDGKLITQDTIREINERETSRIENILDGLLRGRLPYARQAYANYLKPPTK